MRPGNTLLAILVPAMAVVIWGCKGGARVDEARQPEVETGKAEVEWIYSKLAGVWFTRSEITVSQYRACVNAKGKGCTNPDTGGYCNWGYGDRGNHPINCIDWHQAKAVCEWLGGRLPTEDEWFKEASNNFARQYPWGNQQVTCDYAIWGDGSNTDGCGRDSTWPVCSKRKGDSVSGLCDMSGNVWEWTATAYDSNSKVLRGGSWDIVYPGNLRASYRVRDEPTGRGYVFGVRCSRDD